jgi:hypothetical protein
VSYGLGVRLDNPSPVLNTDGNNNFKKGALTPTVWALSGRASCQGRQRFVLNASTFYDDVYHQRNDNKGPISTAGPVNEFNSAAKRYGGGYSRLLDTYAYTSFNMGRPVPRCVWASRW